MASKAGITLSEWAAAVNETQEKPSDTYFLDELAAALGVTYGSMTHKVKVLLKQEKLERVCRVKRDRFQSGGLPVWTYRLKIPKEKR